MRSSIEGTHEFVEDIVHDGSSLWMEMNVLLVRSLVLRNLLVKTLLRKIRKVIALERAARIFFIFFKNVFEFCRKRKLGYLRIAY